MKAPESKIESRGRDVARFSALFGMFVLMAFIVLTNVDVLMRWLLNRPINGVADVAPLVIAIVVGALFPYALAERYHIAIEFMGSILSLRLRLWLKATVALVTLVFFTLVAWQIIVYTLDLRASGQTTWVVQIPAAPWWYVVSFFMVLCVFVQLGIFLSDAYRALTCDGSKGGDPEACADEPTLTDSGAR
jgi:TRAP-type C4-dicarboxylate transport system permease small subunit